VTIARILFYETKCHRVGPGDRADLGGFAAANDHVGKRDPDIRESLGNKFPKHIYHTIVCIGALIAHRESAHWAVDALV
jgi:hypothetical protein